MILCGQHSPLKRPIIDNVSRMTSGRTILENKLSDGVGYIVRHCAFSLFAKTFIHTYRNINPGLTIKVNLFIMSPTPEISQQPQPQQVEMTTPHRDGVVSEQPVSDALFTPSSIQTYRKLLTIFHEFQATNQPMRIEPGMHLRGGGAVGDWYDTLSKNILNRLKFQLTFQSAQF